MQKYFKNSKTLKISMITTFIILFLSVHPSYSSPTNDIKAISFVTEETKKIYLFNVTGSFDLIPPEANMGSFKLYIHIPIAYDSQQPLAIYVAESTGKCIEKYSIVNNYPGPNSLLEVTFKNLETNNPIHFYWTAPVLVEHKDYLDLPQILEFTNPNELPSETKQWLEPSEFIQANHPEIIANATQIIGNETNVIKITESICNFTGTDVIYLGAGPQDALSTLYRLNGVCTGKSNLAAALFRAVGIPARVVMTSPIPHFLIEIYLHPYGWIRVEATPGVFPWEFHRNIISYCVYPEDETASSVRNGAHPYEGKVWYYSDTNPEIMWGFDREKCSFMRYELETTKTKIDQALQSASQIFSNYSAILNKEMIPRQEKMFQSIINEQKEAEILFTSRKMDSFLNKLSMIEELYYEFNTDNSSFNINSMIITLFIVLIPVQALSRFKKKKMLKN